MKKILIPFPLRFAHRVGMDIKQGFLTTLTAFSMFATVASAADKPVLLEVDATDAPRCLLHAKLHIPVSPGKLTLYYPKWIPGEHGPTGPINDLTGLQFSANGKSIEWQRDADEMYTFHLDVPAGADVVDASLDLLLPSGGGSSTARLLDLNWNQILLYPQTDAALKILFTATLKLPANWKYGTALPVAD
ncbi:MAG TPA: hypothetical protein VG347_07100, partial [Verrucomicrobiae bacterium]|nr:hypothetical protein [Verrucomicrobiae bacterium]